MSSRHEVLNRLRSHTAPSVDLPRLDHERQRFDDLAAQFSEILKAVGGEAVCVADRTEINSELAKLPSYAAAKKIVSLVPEIGQSNVHSATLVRPHELEDVDYAILAAHFGVAENAAVWLDLSGAKHRVISVLSQHLCIVLPKHEIVPTMHEAYRRIATTQGGFIDSQGYGLFLSGPSKTADIEQSLVIGAHGARSLTVFLLENP